MAMRKKRMRPMPRGGRIGDALIIDRERQPRRPPQRYSPIRPLPGNLVPDAGGIPDFNPMVPRAPRVPMVPDAFGPPDLGPMPPPVGLPSWRPPNFPTPQMPDFDPGFYNPTQMPDFQMPMPEFMGPFSPPPMRRAPRPRMRGGFGGFRGMGGFPRNSGGFGSY